MHECTRLLFFQLQGVSQQRERQREGGWRKKETHRQKTHSTAQHCTPTTCIVQYRAPQPREFPPCDAREKKEKKKSQKKRLQKNEQQQQGGRGERRRNSTTEPKSTVGAHSRTAPARPHASPAPAAPVAVASVAAAASSATSPAPAVPATPRAVATASTASRALVSAAPLAALSVLATPGARGAEARVQQALVSVCQKVQLVGALQRQVLEPRRLRVVQHQHLRRLVPGRAKVLRGRGEELFQRSEGVRIKAQTKKTQTHKKQGKPRGESWRTRSCGPAPLTA